MHRRGGLQDLSGSSVNECRVILHDLISDRVQISTCPLIRDTEITGHVEFLLDYAVFNDMLMFFSPCL